jgi:hypothetical protein
MKQLRQELANMVAPQTLLVVIAALATIVALKAVCLYCGFNWL